MDRHVIEIKEIKDGLHFIFNDGEDAKIFRFGKDLFCTTSERVLKKTLVNIKQDVKDTDFNFQELRRLWLK